MNRAMRPIEFISAHILNMNLDSFVAVSKYKRIEIKFHNVCSYKI